MVVQVNDVSRETAALAGEFRNLFDGFIKSGRYILGENCERFEDSLSTYLGVSGAVGVGNGTDALRIAMSTLGVADGSVVAVTPNAAAYAAVSARSLGAEIAWFDVTEDGQASPESFEALITDYRSFGRKIDVVVVTHLYGRMAPVEKLTAIATSYGIRIIEDCAQAIGARRNNRLAGSFGDLATFSFYPTKNLGALGDGGAIVGNDPTLLGKARKLSQYGWSEKYVNTIPGGQNSRLDEIQAAFLCNKMMHLDDWNSKRLAIYRDYLSAVSANAKFINPLDETFNGHLAVLRIKAENRTFIREELLRRGVSTDIHYPVPDHLQPIFRDSRRIVSLANAEELAKSVISVPLFPFMTNTERDSVCRALARI